MRHRGLVLAACAASLLSAGPLLSAPDRDGPAGVEHHVARFNATVLDLEPGAIKLERDGGAVEIISFGDAGLNIDIDRHVAIGSKVTVTERVTSGSRSLTVRLADDAKSQ